MTNDLSHRTNRKLSPGSALSPGRHPGAGRGQLLPLLGDRGRGVAPPLRPPRRRTDRHHPRPGAGPVRLARLRPRRRRRPALRVQGPRSLRPGPGSPVQRPEAADRPVREGAHRQDRQRGKPVAGLRPGRPGAGPLPRPPGKPGRRPEGDRGGRPVRLEGGRATVHPVRTDGDLRDAPEGIHRPPLLERRAPGDVPRLHREDPSPSVPRSERRRAAPRPRVLRRGLPPREGAHELLGVQYGRLLRSRVVLRHRPPPRVPGGGVQDARAGAAPRGDRGDPRRGVQPHGRGERAGPHLLVQGDRQSVVLRADRRSARPGPLLHELDRLRQLLQPVDPPRDPAGDGFAAVLGRGDARRRVPVRSRLRAGARGRDVPEVRLLLRRRLPGPGAAESETHRGAVGPGGVRGGELPRRLVGVERPVPRHGAQVRQGRRRAASGPRIPADGIGRPVRRRRAFRLQQRQLRHLPRRVHPARSGLLQREAQRGEPRGEPGRQRRPTTPGTAARKGRRTTRRSRGCGGGWRRTTRACCSSPPEPR